ncbi:hypothetical protein KIL84_019121 [Mauremys mutica]|uniref:Uncharacterized protein n=1 Tax=Mauremys mutica TaxID=74926 RepID=A0A9D4B334_9SAUR|nr:hypothetical protein KIL84_019121 [Mauremys mutica]
MDFNHSETNVVLRNFLEMYVEERKSVRLNNFTSPALKEQEEITASFYILIIVGFFGFLLFSLMISNIVSNKPENYIDYLYSGKFNNQGNEKGLHRKESKDISVTISDKVMVDPNNTREWQKTDSNNNEPEAPSQEAILRNI